MHLKLSALRKLVREAAMTVSALPQDIGLVLISNEWSVQMALVDLPKLRDVVATQKIDEDTVEQFVIGGITASSWDVWRVDSVWSQRRYGPLLYRLAMQYATAQGSALSAHMSGETSQAARRVWERFASEPDVKAVRVEGDGIRGVAYSMSGRDYEDLAARYEALNLDPATDKDVKYCVVNVIRYHSRM